MPEELEVVNLSMDQQEFHLVILLLDSVAAKRNGDIFAVVRNAIAEREYIEQLGFERLNGLLNRVKKLHEAVCPTYTERKTMPWGYDPDEDEVVDATYELNNEPEDEDDDLEDFDDEDDPDWDSDVSDEDDEIDADVYQEDEDEDDD